MRIAKVGGLQTQLQHAAVLPRCAVRICAELQLNDQGAYRGRSWVKRVALNFRSYGASSRRQANKEQAHRQIQRLRLRLVLFARVNRASLQAGELVHLPHSQPASHSHVLQEQIWRRLLQALALRSRQAGKKGQGKAAARGQLLPPPTPARNLGGKGQAFHHHGAAEGEAGAGAQEAAAGQCPQGDERGAEQAQGSLAAGQTVVARDESASANVPLSRLLPQIHKCWANEGALKDV